MTLDQVVDCDRGVGAACIAAVYGAASVELPFRFCCYPLTLCCKPLLLLLGLAVTGGIGQFARRARIKATRPHATVGECGYFSLARTCRQRQCDV